MHVQINRLSRDMRLAALKERMKGWFDEARSRRPCVLVLDDLDVMLGPESEVSSIKFLQLLIDQLAQSLQPEIIANAFINLINGLTPTAGVYVIATALGEDSLHPVLAAKHTFGQTLKVKPLSKDTRSQVLAGLVASKIDGGEDALDYVTLAGMTEGYSVTDLQDLLGNTLQQAIIRHGYSVDRVSRTGRGFRRLKGSSYLK